MNQGSLVASFLLICALVLDAAPVRAEPIPFEVGETTSALPGIVRISVPGRFERIGPGVAASAGYGLTEAVVAQSDKSQRVFGSLAASYRATDWFAAGVRFDGRYDWHTDVPGGNGGGAVGDPGLFFQVGTTSKDFRLGTEARIGFPGGKAPSLKVDATSPELSLLAAYAPVSAPLALASKVGFRIDRSAQTVDDPSRVSLADRISLGVSDTNALLLGAGISARLTNEIEALAEWTWDVRVPSNGVSASDSPMRVDAGGRYRASDTVMLQLVAEVTVSGRPPIDVGAPLAVVEPRLSIFAGFAFRPKTPSVELPAPPPPPVTIVAPTKPTIGRVAVRVTDDGGRPIVGAKVHIGPPERADQNTNERGELTDDGAPVGKSDVTVDAEGYRQQVRTITVTSTESPTVEIQLERALPVGQIRGLARSFGGEAIKATVRVEPIGKELVVGAGGRFEVDVPPGEYDVIVKAPGYADQQRHVRVEANGVVVLDLDMRTRR